MEQNTIKETKFAKTLMIYVSLAFSMIYVAAVDSFSNFEIFAYGSVIAGLWYIVNLLDKKVKELSK